MRSTLLLAGLLALGPALPAQADSPAAPSSASQVEFFEKHIRPMLAEHCLACHGAKKQKGNLRLDTAAGLRQGSESGPVVVPGQPEKSLLLVAVRQDGEVKMPPPPRPKLSPQAIADLAAWVKMGTPWPADKAPSARAEGEPEKKHWAFQPVQRPPLPQVRDARRARTPLDRFVLARLEAKGLTLAAEADRRTLLRRVTFDLTGLPPTPEDVAAFLADPSPAAYAKVVDRLLASPAYGERWGRYWLDVARYADTKGYVFTDERRYPFSYTYRDWVIRVLNEDLPYDQFIVQQLAADRLVATDPSQDRRSLAAMGFLTLGRRFLNNKHDIIDDRIDVVSRGLLGLTVGCARCHDHKYDPIPQKDYYSLYGVFASSTEPRDLPEIGTPERTPAYLNYDKELKARQAATAKFRAEHQAELAGGNRKFRDELRALQKRVDQWRATNPAAPPQAMVIVDLPTPQTPHVFKRGNPNIPGPAVPRQFLAVLSGPERQPFHEGSGRLELARAIADPRNPLTARVLVNRVWLHHFGKGLVSTPSDFGLRSDPPSHPELLDWLAATFVQDGWSLKKLHRLILLSQVYRQSSGENPTGLQVDPDNRLLWRMNRQRLDFEAMRDALLAVSGRLDRTAGGRAVDITKAPFPPRRTVYGFIDRQNLPGLFRTFDFASPDTTSPRRFQTTVPQQALFLLNNPFVIEQARALVARPEVAGTTRPEQRIQVLYRLAFGRSADPDEVALGQRYLQMASQTASQRLSAWERYAQVLLLSNEFVFVD
jgi:mono/diheme cytochrome c family protein